MRSNSPDTGLAAADLAACRAQLRDGSRTFLAASRLLPRRVANAACALYAFCRDADDLVDAPGAGRGAVEGMRDRLALIYLGRPRDVPADRAFTRIVGRYNIPRALPEALLEGFEWDAHGRTYQDLAALQDYAARVAGAVGAMMALIMGASSAESLARACDLGVAMQLSNIARDVGEDARLGRIYLPIDWLEEEGIDAQAFIAAPQFDDRVARVVERLLVEADGLYRRASSGVADLPVSCRPAIELARLLYCAIGNEVARRRFDSISSRAVVSPTRKAGIAVAGLAALPFRSRSRQLAPLEATRFLVDATRSTGDRSNAPEAASDASAQWLLEMFTRLQQRDRSAERAEQRSRLALP